MTKRWIVGAVAALMLAGGGLSYYLTRGPGGLPPSVFDRMTFPRGTADMAGDQNGRICHEVRLQNREGVSVVARGYIDGKDFRVLTSAEKKSAIIESAKSLTEAAGLLACSADPGLPFQGAASAAFAPPTCLDCDGGCGAASCPAHVVEPGCEWNGPDCLITIICCTGSCNCGSP